MAVETIVVHVEFTWLFPLPSTLPTWSLVEVWMRPGVDVCNTLASHDDQNSVAFICGGDFQEHPSQCHYAQWVEKADAVLNWDQVHYAFKNGLGPLHL